MIERFLERLISQSRWIMAPFYLGLIASLLVLLYTFIREFFHFVLEMTTATEADVILGVLALIDLSLAANLVLIVVFSGYENFVSKIDPEGHPDWPEWMTKIDFSGLKQKLMASIVAISAIQVLKAFMNIDKNFNEKTLIWLVVIHLVFVVSGLMLAWTDLLGERAKGKAKESG
ncbi:MAG: TIGR00645 family protein [Xanthobacteraceae bacterium]